MNFSGEFFELLVENVNASIRLLNEYGTKIKDESDSNYYLKEIRYSPANDEVITSFKSIK